MLWKMNEIWSLNIFFLHYFASPPVSVFHPCRLLTSFNCFRTPSCQASTKELLDLLFCFFWGVFLWLELHITMSAKHTAPSSEREDRISADSPPPAPRESNYSCPLAEQKTHIHTQTRRKRNQINSSILLSLKPTRKVIWALITA